MTNTAYGKERQNHYRSVAEVVKEDLKRAYVTNDHRKITGALNRTAQEADAMLGELKGFEGQDRVEVARYMAPVVNVAVAAARALIGQNLAIFEADVDSRAENLEDLLKTKTDALGKVGKLGTQYPSLMDVVCKVDKTLMSRVAKLSDYVRNSHGRAAYQEQAA